MGARQVNGANMANTGDRGSETATEARTPAPGATPAEAGDGSPTPQVETTDHADHQSVGPSSSPLSATPTDAKPKGAREAGAEVSLLDLKDFPLPLFDQDLEAEQGMPEAGAKLKRLFIDHDGLLIAAPEYNSSVTAVLKNAIDWVSPPASGEPSLVAFRGKVATLMSASPGALGGLRGLAHPA
jgi:hypothetical protein